MPYWLWRCQLVFFLLFLVRFFFGQRLVDELMLQWFPGFLESDVRFTYLI